MWADAEGKHRMLLAQRDRNRPSGKEKPFCTSPAYVLPSHRTQTASVVQGCSFPRDNPTARV